MASTASTIHVEAARIPDRDRLLAVLRENGLDASAENEIGIEVPTHDGGAELFHTVETIVMQLGAPFVPIKHEGVIYIRPPLS